MSLYISTANIKGNVTIKGLENSIQIESYQHLGQRMVRQNVGTTNKEISPVQLNHMSIVKAVDGASADLWQYFLTAKVIPELTIARVNLNSGYPEWQSKIILSNVMVTNIQEVGNAIGHNETIELAYSKIERSYRQQNNLGRWQTPKHVSFNLQTAKAE